MTMVPVNLNVVKKFKNAVKLPSSEASGCDIEIEVREDDEQSEKLNGITDILVAAGYFRARIKRLSPFDKVLGGMIWCIESCNVDVDIDLLFQENSTIGQKIALTEKIVAALPKMKCPHAIEPHQIQGLDFIHIFPVIQWLVKRSMENRQEIFSFVRSYAVNQFDKQFEVKRMNADGPLNVLKNLNTVCDKYRPHRYYKRKSAIPPGINFKVQMTLLEYGFMGVEINKDSNYVSNEISMEQNQKLEQELVDYNDLNDEERGKLLVHYALLQTELKDGVKSQQQHDIRIVEEEIQVLTDRCNKAEHKIISLDKELDEANILWQELRLKQQETDKALQALDQSKISSESMREAEELIKLNDKYKFQELDFRETCKKELSMLRHLLMDAKNPKSKTSTGLKAELSKEIDTIKIQVRILKLQIAKKNRVISALQRQLDDIPNRAELAQYQRRFFELYNQVAAKHQETKQYYTLYNTLEDTRLYMQKELSLLNSISENYPEALQSVTSKEEFLQQFQNKVDGLDQHKLKMEQKLIEENQKRDQLSNTLQSLVEQQRKYVATVRQLSVECKNHEIILSQRQNS